MGPADIISSANDPNKHVPETGIRHQADRRMQLKTLLFTNAALDHIRVETVEVIVGE